MKPVWIIMADVVGSRRSRGKEMARKLEVMTGTINKSCKKELLSPLTVTLGDEFQGVLATAETGLKIIILLEELTIRYSMNIKLRYVLAKGKIDTLINKKIAHGMLGEGLTQTREALTELKKTDVRFMVIGSGNAPLLNKYFVLYQSLVDGWKPKDLSIVSDFFETDDYKAVADKNKKTWSQMWKRRKSLKIKEYKIIRQLILGENGVA